MSAFWAAIASGALRNREPERKGWKITLRDDSLPHQIRLSVTSAGTRNNLLAVSCTCRKYPLDVRDRFEPHEPMEIWRQHMAGVNAA